TLFVPDRRRLRAPGLRRGQVRHDAAAPDPRPPRGAVARPQDRRPPGDLDRPLPVLLQRAAIRSEVLQAAGPERLQQDPQRRAGRGDAPAADLRRRGQAAGARCCGAACPGRSAPRGSDVMANHAASWRDRETLMLSRTDMMGLLAPAASVAGVAQAYRMHGEGRCGMEPKGHIVLAKYPGE